MVNVRATLARVFGKDFSVESTPFAEFEGKKIGGGAFLDDAHANDWLDSAAVFTRVGKSIRLYHIPKPGAAPAARP